MKNVPSEVVRGAPVQGDSETRPPAGAPDESGELGQRAISQEFEVHRIAVELRDQLRVTQSQLEQSEARYEALCELAPVGYITLDSYGRVRQANARAAQTLGLTRIELLGKPLARFTASQMVHVLHSHLKSVAHSGAREACELEFEGQGPLLGRRLPVRLESLASLTASGYEYRCALIELWELRQEQQARKQSELRLYQAQKMEALGTLASGVAHDFNNLLMGIRSCASIGRSKLEPGDPVCMLLDQIVQATTNGAGVTQQLLGLGRRRDERTCVLQLNALVSRTKWLLGHLLGEDIDVKLRLSADDSRVRTDPAQFEQVLVNLAVNARQAMPAGGTLSIETACVSEDGTRSSTAGKYIRLTVADTGVGMSETTRERVFEPFFTTKPGVGTGLGLAMVHGVVQRAGGHIRVHSVLGEGTRFEVLLPHVADPVDDLDSGEEKEIPSPGGTVLVVEDELLVRVGIRFYLAEAGYRVLEASSGPEALDCCAKFSGQIDVLLTDVVLPGMCGRDIAHESRSLRPGLRVLFMSAHPLDVLIDQGRLSERSRVLQKPFGSIELLNRVARLLSDKRSAREAPEPVVARSEAAPRSDGARGTVLVVDDEPLARSVICDYLRDLGWTVREASDPEQALAIAHDEAIRVLLTDHRLPLMTGDALARRVKELHPGSVVVYMSGFCELDLDPPGLILTKPLDLEDVAAAVESAAGAEASEEPGRHPSLGSARRRFRR